MSQRSSRLLSFALPEYEAEEDLSRSRMFDQIQREAEQELQNAEKVLLAADSVVGETRSPTRVSEPGCSTGKRDHQQHSQSERSSRLRFRRSSAPVPATQGQINAGGYPSTGRLRPAVLPTNTPDFGSGGSSVTAADSRHISMVPGPRSFPFRTPLTSEIFYAFTPEQIEKEADRESADFESTPNHLPFTDTVDKNPSSRSRELDLKDSKVNSGHSSTSSRYGSKRPYSKEKLTKAAFQERDKILCGNKAGFSSNPSQGNDQFCSIKYTSECADCSTRMPSWNTKEDENCFNPSKNLHSFPQDQAFADYNFDFGTRARSPPEYLTGGSPYFQETNEPTPPTSSASYLNPSYTQQSTAPPPHNSSAHHNHSNTNQRPEDQQRTNELLAPLQQLSQLTGTDKYSSCSRLFTARLSMPDFDSQPGETSKRIRQLPKKPDLTKDQINDLIENENLDVNSAFILYSDDRKTYKKPCPKQQKAQMNVKQIVTAHKTRTSINQCDQEKEYFPMEEPDPDDLSPDLAAKMMFSQEKGIRLDSCPSETIKFLFPDDHVKPHETHQSMVSVVNPSYDVEMLSKTSFVPEHGASDSAYSRMKGKGEDMANHRPHEFEPNSNAEKREYVVVAQKPARFNITQFRGNLPSWFPGYFTAFPDQVKAMSTVGSPTAAFNRAWANTNPANIPAQDVLILES